MPMPRILVVLPSGEHANLWVPYKNPKVADLKLVAETHFKRGFLKLVAPDGRVLDPNEELENVRLNEGDYVTAVAMQVKLATTDFAFALWSFGGDKVITWGDPKFGGDSTKIQDRLHSPVQQVQGSNAAFAALLADGTVVTWGDELYGALPWDVEFEALLQNVQELQSTKSAFAAILRDGSVQTWGEVATGGSSSAVKDELNKVCRIESTKRAFAAIREDGRVITWGDPQCGADSKKVETQLRQVQHIGASWAAFAALRVDETVVTWGDDVFGADSTGVQDELHNVQQICSSKAAFAAILRNGTVARWWFQIPYLGKIPILTNIFSNGSKPPTRLLLGVMKTMGVTAVQ